MKRKLLVIVTTLCLLALCAVQVLAASPRLVDDADLLLSGEADRIEEILDEVSSRQKLDIVVVTVDSTEGKTPMDFADDYYDTHGYAEDGILLLVSMEESDWWVSTAGYGIQVVTDAGLEYMADRFVPCLSDGEYADAFETFAELCDQFIHQANSGDPYDSHNLPKEPFSVVGSLAVALVTGLVAALVVTGAMKRKLKTVRTQARADDYVTPGSMQLTHSRDMFLYTHLDRREKPKSSSGSSTHVSSSGRVHGGGGGKF